MSLNPTAEAAVNMLQSAFAADPAAIHALVCNRVPCNGALEAHPHVIVDASPVIQSTATVGALGLINGMLLALDCDHVVGLRFDDEKGDAERKLFKGFVLVPRQRG